MMAKNPDERPTPQQILDMQWKIPEKKLTPSEKPVDFHNAEDIILQGIQVSKQLSIGSMPITEICEFVPSVATLRALSPLAVYKACLTHVIHFKSSMAFTSFRLGGQISPPPGTYEKEPETDSVLPEEIKELRFNTCK
jgi:hypothetical protein